MGPACNVTGRIHATTAILPSGESIGLAGERGAAEGDPYPPAHQKSGALGPVTGPGQIISAAIMENFSAISAKPSAEGLWCFDRRIAWALRACRDVGPVLTKSISAAAPGDCRKIGVPSMINLRMKQKVRNSAIHRVGPERWAGLTPNLATVPRVPRSIPEGSHRVHS